MGAAGYVFVLLCSRIFLKNKEKVFFLFSRNPALKFPFYLPMRAHSYVEDDSFDKTSGT